MCTMLIVLDNAPILLLLWYEFRKTITLIAELTISYSSINFLRFNIKNILKDKHDDFINLEMFLKKKINTLHEKLKSLI